MQLVDYLDDLTVRFLINGPYSELSSVSRICFQLEEAQWYYEDFIRPSEAAKGIHLPHMPLQDFCLAMMKNCPFTNMFTAEQHLAAYATFLQYKVRIPVRGAILLDESMENAVLVKGYKKGANWSFPRGKINQDEDDLDCAIREVYEETGYDFRAAGLMPGEKDWIDITMREQHLRLYIVRNVPLDTHFETRTRKEISKIGWWRLRDLPGHAKKGKTPTDPTAVQAGKFYMVAPVLGHLKKWIAAQRRAQQPASESLTLQRYLEAPEAETDDGQLTDFQNNEKRSEELKQLLNIGVQPQAQLTQENLQSRSHEVEVRHFQHYPLHYLQQGMPPPQAGFPPQYQSPAQFVHQGQYQDPFATSAPYSYGPPPEVQQYGNGSLPRPNEQTGYDSMPFQQSLPVQSQLTPTGYPHASQQSFQQRFAPGFGAHQVPPGAQPLHNTHEESIQAAPKAEDLPAPKLNAHAMNLLAAFKRGNSQQNTTESKQSKAQPNAHQARLLDLFKSPAPTPVSTVPAPVTKTSLPSAAATKKEEVPPNVEDTLPISTTSLNQFTRTLPTRKSKPKQPPVQLEPVAPSNDQALNASVNTAMKNQSDTGQSKMPIANGRHAHNDLRTTAHSRGTTGSPRNTTSSHSPASSVSKSARTKQGPEPAKVPTFTILTRPESVKDTSTVLDFKPQVLKRPSSDAAPVADGNSDTPTGQQDRLLALFAKGKPPSNLRSPAQPRSVKEVPSTSPIDPGKGISILRHSPPQQPEAPGAVLVKAPAAPTLAPEERPSRIISTPQNNALLSLFKNNTTSVTSPETPISPFTLGSPNVLRHQAPPLAAGSMGPPSSPLSGVGLDKQRPDVAVGGRKPSISATPTEAKGFLLGFLNDVVQKEGRST